MSESITATAPRVKVSKPVHGTVKVLSPFDARGVAVITINGTGYQVELLLSLDGESGPLPGVLGFRLSNHRSGQVYDVDAGEVYWTCSCPDHIYRRDGVDNCKHVKALRAALCRLVGKGAR